MNIQKTNSKPNLTPFQALKRLNEKEDTCEIVEDGFTYTLDAPQMCDDPDFFYPIAFKDGWEWYPAGDVNDKITEGSYWLEGEC